MTETAVAAGVTTKLASSEIRKAAGGAAALAIVLATIDAFVGSNGGLVTVAIVTAVVGVATVGVFLLAVPWALNLEEPGTSVVAVLASLLGLLTVVIFWSGLPPVFAAAGIVLGRSQASAWEGRFYARAAEVVGFAAIALYVVRVFADIVSSIV